MLRSDSQGTESLHAGVFSLFTFPGSYRPNEHVSLFSFSFSRYECKVLGAWLGSFARSVDKQQFMSSLRPRRLNFPPQFRLK